MNQRIDFKAKGNSQAVTHLTQEDNDTDSQCFFIKTLQIFDKEGNALDDPILVEQVYGNFDSYRLYDISTLHYKDSLYYFKRKFVRETKSVNEQRADNLKSQSPLVKQEKDLKAIQLG